MERLTTKREADAQREAYERRIEQGYPRNIPEERFLKLAAYEDTGLTPADVAKFWAAFCEARAIAQALGQEYADRADTLLEADTEGRLLVLPCKVGDTVYTNIAMSGWYLRSRKRPYSAKVVFIGINANDGMGGGLINVTYNKSCCMMQFYFSDIGKTVFLTHEEAEKALEGMGNDYD